MKAYVQWYLRAIQVAIKGPSAPATFADDDKTDQLEK